MNLPDDVQRHSGVELDHGHCPQQLFDAFAGTEEAPDDEVTAGLGSLLKAAWGATTTHAG